MNINPHLDLEQSKKPKLPDHIGGVDLLLGAQSNDDRVLIMRSGRPIKTKSGNYIELHEVSE